MKKSLIGGVTAVLLWGVAGVAHSAEPGQHVDPAPLPVDVVEQLHAASRVVGSDLPDALARVLSSVGPLLADIQAQEAGVLRGASSKRPFLDATLQELSSVKSHVLAQLRERRGVSPQVIAHTQQRIERIEQSLRAVQAAQSPASLRAALTRARQDMDELFERGYRQQNEAPLAVRPNWTAQEPQKGVAQPAAKAQPAYYTAQLAHKPVQYAFLGSTLLAAAPATPTEASTCSYVAGDLAETEEVKLTTEIRALAESLGYSPVRIYQWVYDNIKFEPYYGSLKGATGTLYAKAGSATDQASLLIALLRASNIPARYVKGQVAIFDDTAQNNANGRAARWVGAKSYVGAYKVLAAGQNPATGTFSIGTTVQGIQATHVWVEACVPYGHYRGARVDLAGHRWVPLDASFKDRSYRAGIATGVNFNYATTGAGYLAKRSNDLPEEVYARSVLTAAKALAPNYGNNALADVPASWTQTPRRVDVLPATLPYTVLEFLAWDGATGPAEVANLPDRHRYKYTITAKNAAGTALATTTLSMPAVILNRVTLSFKGKDATNQTNLTNWQAGTAAPPTTIQVVPVIKVEGADVAVGTTAVTLDTANNGLVLAVTLGDLGHTTQTSCPTAANSYINCVTYSNIGAANYHALQAYGFQASDRLLAERAAKLIANVRGTTSNPNANGDNITGEFLHLVSLKYMRYITDAGKRVGALDGGSGDSGNHLGLASTQMRVKYLFDQPFEVHRDGYLIDVPGGLSRTRDLSTGDFVWKTFKLTGYASSAYESYIWQENARLDAVSTVRGLQFAAEKGIEILSITTANKSTQLAKLTANTSTTPGCTAGAAVNYSSTQAASIGTLVDEGKTVTIPRCLIQYDNWKGAVYAAELNGASASALFAINQYSGGYTTQSLPSISYNPYSNSGWLVPNSTSLASLITPASLVNIGNGASSYNTYSGDPVNMVTGNMYHNETDLVIKGRGLPLVFSRAYNSRGAIDGPLGFGWTHSFNHYLRFDDDNLDGTSNAADTDGLTSSVTWVDGTGAEKGIKVAGTSTGVANGATFTPPLGNYFTVTRSAADGKYRITEKSGMVYTFESIAGTKNQKARLLSIADRNGNTITLGYDPVTQLLTTVSDGVTAARKLTFTYVGTRITQISDWTGRYWQYGYDGNGNLTSYKTPLAVLGKQPAKTYTYIVDASVDANGKTAPVNHAMKTVVEQNGYTMTFEYYLNGKVFRHTNSSGHASTFTYNDFRRESVHVNERGVSRRFFFDQYGNPIRTVEADGSELNYSYFTGTTGSDNPYLRKTAKNAEGYTTQYAYDANGNVTTVTLPDNSTIVSSDFTFGSAGKVKDARGNYRIAKFDAKGNVLQNIAFKAGVGSAVAPSSYTPAAADIVSWTVSTYDTYGNPATVTRIRNFAAQVSTPTGQNGPRLTYDWNDTANGTTGLSLVKLTSNGDANGDGLIDANDVQPAAISKTYDNLGRALTTKQGAYTVTSSYDELDRVSSVIDGNGNIRNYQFNDVGNLLAESLTDSATNTLVWKRDYRYDLAGRRLSQADTAGNISLSRYDELGNRVGSTNADNYSIALEYDAMDRAIKAFDAKGNVATTAYDTLGRRLSVTDPNGSTVKSVYYDATRNGRLKQSLDGIGRATTYDYDANGNVITVTDNAARVTTTTYDELNRPTLVVGAQYTDAVLGAVKPVTKFVYDNLGNRKEVWAGHNNGTADVLTIQRTDVYDDFGRRISGKDALNQLTKYGYDQYGNLNKLTDAKNQITNMVYEYGPRLKTLTDHALRVTSYTYNALNQPKTIASPGVTYTYEYDAANRLKKVTDSRKSKALNYTYSRGGKLLITQDSDANRTDYLYDDIGRLIGVWAPNLDYVSFAWDAGGRMKEKWLSNGVNTVYSYNADGTLKQVKNRMGYSDANVITQHDYTYNNVGLRSRHIEKIGASTVDYTYGYDELSRLTSVKNTANSAVLEAYSYDPLNNRRTKTDSAAAVLAYVYDAANQLKEVRQNTTTGALVASLSYDANGNMTSTQGGWTLGYDVVNRLTSATKSGQSSQAYVYDHSGRRISKTVGTTTTNYLMDGSDVAGEYNGDWTTTQALYTHGGGTDDPLLRVAAGVASYFHQDGLGSVVATSNASGVSTGTQRFDSYGVKGAVTGAAIAQYGYTGREPDETGLSFYRARYYDPAVGRFTQRDPIGFGGGLNHYAYVSGNPTNLTDPSGTVVHGSIARAVDTYFSSSTSSVPQATPYTGVIDFGYKALPQPSTVSYGFSDPAQSVGNAFKAGWDNGQMKADAGLAVANSLTNSLQLSYASNNSTGDSFKLAPVVDYSKNNYGLTASGSVNNVSLGGTVTGIGSNATNGNVTAGYNFGNGLNVTGGVNNVATSPTGKLDLSYKAPTGGYINLGASGMGSDATTGSIKLGYEQQKFDTNIGLINIGGNDLTVMGNITIPLR